MSSGVSPGSSSLTHDPAPSRACCPMANATHFRVQGSGCKVQGSGFRVQGSGCRVQGSGFRVQGSRLLPHGERHAFFVARPVSPEGY